MRIGRNWAKLARRVSDVLTYDVIFSRHDPALFHGDPHAGNVFHAPSAEDPYRLGLIDWGLAAEFTLEERRHVAQLMLGLYLKDEKRLANHAGVLVDGATGAEDAVRMRTAVAMRYALLSGAISCRYHKAS